jgi:hypothetical protein
MEPIKETSPRLKARIAGIAYLLVFLMGVFSLGSGKLFVSGDAAATAANILSHEPLFQWGWFCSVMGSVFYVVVTALFYELFKPVNKSISLIAAFFSLVGCAIGAVSTLFQLAALLVVKGGPSIGAFTTAQLQALAYLFVKLFGQSNNIGLIFFGFYCTLIGYLVFRSTFLPRILAVLMFMAGLAWLTYLSPALAHRVFPYHMALGILGEASLTLWLIVAGVNSERWKEQANAARG